MSAIERWLARYLERRGYKITRARVPHNPPKVAKPAVTRRRPGTRPHACDERCAWLANAIKRDPPPSLTELGRHLGLSRERIRQLIGQHGWHKPRTLAAHQQHVCDDRCAWLADAIESDPAPSMAELGLHLGISHVAVQQRIAQHGWQKRRVNQKFERNAWVAALYEAGWTYRDIAEYVGGHWTAIGPMLRRIGIPANRRTGHSPHQQQRNAWIVALYEAGWTYDDIASYIGIHRSNVPLILRRVRYPLGRPRQITSVRAIQILERAAWVVALYEAGWTWSGIAGYVGISLTTVRKALRDSGYPLRRTKKGATR